MPVRDSGRAAVGVDWSCKVTIYRKFTEPWYEM